MRKADRMGYRKSAESDRRCKGIRDQQRRRPAIEARLPTQTMCKSRHWHDAQSAGNRREGIAPGSHRLKIQMPGDRANMLIFLVGDVGFEPTTR
jgi:hypothetical protein